MHNPQNQRRYLPTVNESLRPTVRKLYNEDCYNFSLVNKMEQHDRLNI